ncbi:hypothetical protein ABZ845_13620 [Streptomyces sp. NPDC047022]|uniref:hypothetical protein n=1 Tax=Streptomyces sp. NPDC047022 TaxID=3155737 RepID=UPI0033C8580F
MWPGEQPPGGGQSPQQPTDGQQPNPYQQPGYHQPNPYQQSQPWNTPGWTPGMPGPAPAGRGPNRTKIVSLVGAAAVVIATGVTGFVLLGGQGRGGVDPGPTKSPLPSPSRSTDNPRQADGKHPMIKGWKVVVNPDAGIAFDVPPQWALKAPSWVDYVTKNGDSSDNPLIAMQAPAALEEKWCASDENKDGTMEYTPLAEAGSRGNRGANSPEEIAGKDPETWVYGAYTQPDRSKVKAGPVKSFTSASGLTGSLGSAWSVGVKKSKKCQTDGKAWTFAFKTPQGDLSSWSFVGVKGASEGVPDATVEEIASTVRLFKDTSGG